MAILDYESDKDAWIDEGKAVGRAEGIAEGRVESLLDSVRFLMHKKGWSGLLFAPHFVQSHLLIRTYSKMSCYIEATSYY